MDVQATWRIYQELRTLYVKHGRSRPIDRIYSEASLGKAYLDDFGITPFMKQNPDFDRRDDRPIHGNALWRPKWRCAFAITFARQCRRILKVNIRAINALMRMQELLIAERIEAVKGGTDSSAAQFLRGVTLADMQIKETWPKLRGVALIKPRGDILPVRTVFEANEDNARAICQCNKSA